MNTEIVDIAGTQVEVHRKRIKNLHLGVYPPNGLVRVAAPAAMSLDAIKVAVLTRMAWVRRKQDQFARQDRETPRRYVSGETHYVFGRARRLTVVTSNRKSDRVELHGNDRILFHVPHESTVEQRRNWMNAWYRAELRRIAAPRIEKWSELMGVSPNSWGIRQMKTKWGSCNPVKKSVWLNLELSRKPFIAIDYVIVHEFAHFVSPRHDELFVSILDTYMPTWRQVRADLNALPFSEGLGTRCSGGRASSILVCPNPTQ
ncbi:M48 family metallopeptidase [Roseibium sp.]|uniref:M48 family metallopeptidase n=1 Tax=Roseibium sp. TaxID=1936156 RepID=UPI003A969339